MDDINPDAGERFAWCFSHGRLHRFTAEPWCTATWVTLPGVTEAEALAAKRRRFAGALFAHQLSTELQGEVHEE